jgi:F-type H+-transporting ATPase subunit delta
MNFLSLITTKGREELLADIVDEFVKLNEERRNILRIGVESAMELSSTQQTQLTKFLETRTKKTIRMQAHIDAALKGGFIVRIGDTVWDASIRRQLERMQKSLAGEN